jgi:long-subunit fatty acid transport protein
MYNAEAADRWTIELRPGIAYATQDVGDENLNLGIGIEGTVSYRFLPHLAVYGGWDWHHFSTEENEFGESPDVEDTGYAFGLNFIHPLGNSRFSYLVRFGGLYNHIEIESGSGDIVFDSGHGLGWEAGIGVVYTLNDRWRLSPGVRYRSLSRDIELQNMTVPVDLTYFSIDVGVSITF